MFCGKSLKQQMEKVKQLVPTIMRQRKDEKLCCSSQGVKDDSPSVECEENESVFMSGVIVEVFRFFFIIFINTKREYMIWYLSIRFFYISYAYFLSTVLEILSVIYLIFIHIKLNYILSKRHKFTACVSNILTPKIPIA